MPTTYAHWRFGEHCQKNLSANLQETINNNRAIFDYGVHGPDIFFYYNCVKHNEVNQFGSDFHDIPFEKSLIEFRPLYQKADDKKSTLAYLMGFLCHFVLDSYCHGFVDLIAESTDVTHGKLESQFDRYLMKKDGLDPIKTKRYASLKPGHRIAHDIAVLYPQYDNETIYKVLKDQLFYLKILTDDTSVKRFALEKLFDAANLKSFKDLLITANDDKRCEAYLLRLDKYFDKAVEHYPILLNSMLKFLDKGTELDPYFHNHFCPKEDYKQIPVLPLEEELKYTVDFQK